MWHKHLIKQKIKSVRLDLDIASPFLDSKEIKKLDKLHEDLHFVLWSARPFSKVKIPKKKFENNLTFGIIFGIL